MTTLYKGVAPESAIVISMLMLSEKLEHNMHVEIPKPMALWNEDFAPNAMTANPAAHEGSVVSIESTDYPNLYRVDVAVSNPQQTSTLVEPCWLGKQELVDGEPVFKAERLNGLRLCHFNWTPQFEVDDATREYILAQTGFVVGVAEETEAA